MPYVPSPQVPGPSHLHRINTAVLSCSVCPLVFELNPNVRYRALGEVELIRILLNGERVEAGFPALTGQQLICDPCLFNKMQQYSEAWRLLGMHIHFQMVSL